MLRKLKYILGAATISSLMLTSVSVSQAADMSDLVRGTEATDTNIGLYSQYVFRGQRQSAGALSIQGDAGVTHESGASVNVWFATLGVGNVTEFDVTLDYSADLGFMGYSAGLILYRYHNSGAANATEVYAGVSHEFGSATAYYDIDSKNIWLDLSSGLELSDLAIEGTLSFAAPDVGKSEFVNLAVSVSKDIETRDIIISPSFTYNYHMGALDTLATPDALVLAINIAY